MKVLLSKDYYLNNYKQDNPTESQEQMAKILKELKDCEYLTLGESWSCYAKREYVDIVLKCELTALHRNNSFENSSLNSLAQDNLNNKSFRSSVATTGLTGIGTDTLASSIISNMKHTRYKTIPYEQALFEKKYKVPQDYIQYKWFNLIEKYNKENPVKFNANHSTISSNLSQTSSSDNAPPGLSRGTSENSREQNNISPTPIYHDQKCAFYNPMNTVNQINSSMSNSKLLSKHVKSNSELVHPIGTAPTSIININSDNSKSCLRNNSASNLNIFEDDVTNFGISSVTRPKPAIGGKSASTESTSAVKFKNYLIREDEKQRAMLPKQFSLGNVFVPRINTQKPTKTLCKPETCSGLAKYDYFEMSLENKFEPEQPVCHHQKTAVTGSRGTNDTAVTLKKSKRKDASKMSKRHRINQVLLPSDSTISEESSRSSYMDFDENPEFLNTTTEYDENEEDYKFRSPLQAWRKNGQSDERLETYGEKRPLEASLSNSAPTVNYESMTPVNRKNSKNQITFAGLEDSVTINNASNKNSATLGHGAFSVHPLLGVPNNPLELSMSESFQTSIKSKNRRSPKVKDSNVLASKRNKDLDTKLNQAILKNKSQKLQQICKEFGIKLSGPEGFHERKTLSLSYDLMIGDFSKLLGSNFERAKDFRETVVLEPKSLLILDSSLTFVNYEPKKLRHLFIRVDPEMFEEYLTLIKILG